MDWTVQYKDLKDDLKYKAEPAHGNNAVHLRYGIDDIQYPYPIENHRVTVYNPSVKPYDIV